MDRISKHISYDNATKSLTAIRRGIDNTPNAEQLKAMQLVAEKVFEPLQEWYKLPISVTSFFRSQKLNKAVGGATNSAHTLGEAIDIDCNQNGILFSWIKNNLQFDQLIWEFGDDTNPDWIHVSYRNGVNRNEILKAIYKNGKTKYIKY